MPISSAPLILPMLGNEAFARDLATIIGEVGAVEIDIPVGPTAKVRTIAAGHALADRLTLVGARLGLRLACLLTDGT